MTLTHDEIDLYEKITMVIDAYHIDFKSKKKIVKQVAKRYERL